MKKVNIFGLFLIGLIAMTGCQKEEVEIRKQEASAPVQLKATGNAYEYLLSEEMETVIHENFVDLSKYSKQEIIDKHMDELSSSLGFKDNDEFREYLLTEVKSGKVIQDPTQVEGKMFHPCVGAYISSVVSILVDYNSAWESVGLCDLEIGSPCYEYLNDAFINAQLAIYDAAWELMQCLD